MFIRFFLYIISSIAGTGILVLPSTTIGYGAINVIISLTITTIIFIGLAYLFTQTTQLFEDIKNSFPSWFYKGFSIIYWIFTWCGTIVSIYELSNAILFLINIQKCYSSILVTQCIIISLFIGLHRLGVHKLFFIENIINILKIIILLIIPGIFITYGVQNHVPIDYSFNINNIIGRIPSMMWAYLGIESCSVENNNKHFRKIVLFSVICVFILYLINIIGIVFAMNKSIDLAAPHSLVIKNIFNKWYPSIANMSENFVAICIITLCAGTVSTWYYISAKILQSMKNIVPTKFNNSYFRSVVYSSIGLFPLAFLISNSNIKIIYKKLFDYFSVIGTIFYLVCTYTIIKKYKCYKVGIIVFISLLVFLCYHFYQMLIL